MGVSKGKEPPVKTLLTLASLFALSLAAGGSSAAPVAPETSRVSVSSSGGQGDYSSFAVGISARARYVAFTSDATTLVDGDTNGKRDAFVRDRRTGETTRVSVSSSGKQSNCSDPFGCSSAAGISGDGRYVAIVSAAPNLVSSDTNGAADVFVHDRQTGETTRVSTGSAGREGNGASGWAAMSTDGRYVAFSSGASNLVPGDTNDADDVFVHDRTTGRTTRVSLDSRGRQTNRGSESTAPAITVHGRYVVFMSNASNLVVHDTNNLADVFVRDLRAGRTTRVSVNSRGRQASGDRTGNGSNSPSISANGRYVAFHSAASNLVRGDTNRVFDIFVHDRKTKQTRRVSVSSRGREANAESFGPPSISPDGRYVAFGSLASNLVAGDANEITDVFIHDRRTGRVTLGSLSSDGQQGNDGSANAVGAFSPDDRYLAFSSWSSNLVAGDTNGGPDAFVRRLS
jgi:Tol biopolymer transport system component